MARNRKRAKERRARRPQTVGNGRAERDDALDPIEDAPDPLEHATPDVDLAEAQLALGRPDLTEENEADEAEFELEAENAAETAESARDAGSTDGVAGEALPAPPGAAAPARRNLGGRLIHFLQGSWRELQRVQWPDRRQVMQATGVVIGFVIVAGVYLGIADLLAGKVMNYILTGHFK